MKKSSTRVLIAIAILLLLVVAGIGLLLSFIPGPEASPTQSLLTTKLVVDTSKLSDYQFEVPSNTHLTLSSTDSKPHICNILGINKAINIPQGQPSATFQLAGGEYKLNCGIPNINAKIVSK